MESPRFDYQGSLVEVRSADTAIAILADLIREAGDVYNPPTAPAKSSGSAVVETPYGAVIRHGRMTARREVEEVVEVNDGADDAPIEIVD